MPVFRRVDKPPGPADMTVRTDGIDGPSLV